MLCIRWKFSELDFEVDDQKNRKDNVLQQQLILHELPKLHPGGLPNPSWSDNQSSHSQMCHAKEK